MIANAGKDRVTRLQVSLVAPGGGRHTASGAGVLGPGEELYLAFDEFTPALPRGFRADHAEIVFGPERRRATLPLR
jgi:hypothetical protein